jgi:hypothetical protein
MMKLCVPLVAAVLGLASFAVYAEEVKLTDQDRSELRQRADSLRSSNLLGSDNMSRTMRADDHATKMKHGKKHNKSHMRRSSSKGHT